MHEDDAIQVILNHFLKNMPSKLSLIIESSAVPFLRLTTLLACRQILGLGSNVLRFSPQEVQGFPRLQGFPISEEEAERLVSTFDGWITGMLLATPLGSLSSSRCYGTFSYLLKLTSSFYRPTYPSFLHQE